MPPARPDRRAYLPWLLAALGLAIDCALYWPGQMSFDSAYAWWQARGETVTDVASPTLIALWRITDRLYTGPGPVFALHLAMFWAGLALLAGGQRIGTGWRVALVACGALPIVLVLRGHVWTDVGMLGALLLACGLLAQAHAGRRAALWPALPVLLYALGMRHNAVLAVAPIVAVWAWLAWPGGGPVRRIGTGLLVLAALLAVVAAINRQARSHVPLWPILAQGDLAALSIARGEVLLPAFSVGPGLSVAELAEVSRPWSVTAMLQNNRSGIRDPLGEWPADDLRALREAWFAAIATDPGAYLAHRWRVTRALFGTQPRDWPQTLLYVDAQIGYRDNPPVAPNDGAAHRALMRWVEAWRPTAVFAIWPHLLIGLAAAPLAWRRRADRPAGAALCLLASAWLYALPYPLLAPSAELRYLGWSCLASVLAAVLALAARPAARPAHRPHGAYLFDARGAGPGASTTMTE